MKQIASFGCGVDSVAGLLLNSNYDEIIFADTLDELPETYAYLDYFEKKSGLKITKVKSKHGSLYDYFLKENHKALNFIIGAAINSKFNQSENI